jgi:hypothetical protein
MDAAGAAVLMRVRSVTVATPSASQNGTPKQTANGRKTDATHDGGAVSGVLA